MTTTLARLASVPQASAMPECVELIHCQTAGRIVGIRFNSGAIFSVEPENRSDYFPMNASESAMEYRLGSVVEAELEEAVDAAREEEQDSAKDAALDLQARITELENKLYASQVAHVVTLGDMERVRDLLAKSEPGEALALARKALERPSDV